MGRAECRHSLIPPGKVTFLSKLLGSAANINYELHIEAFPQDNAKSRYAGPTAVLVLDEDTGECVRTTTQPLAAPECASSRLRNEMKGMEHRRHIVVIAVLVAAEYSAE